MTHPHAKPAVRARARELRRQGLTYDEIQSELKCSKSSISLWVSDLPKPVRRPADPARASAAAKRRWEPTMRLREAERQRTRSAATAEIGALTDQQLLIAGVCLYWAEGTKSKPYRPQARVTFMNSDPTMIEVFTAWLRHVGVEPGRVRFSLYIHESADIPTAERFWADLVGITVGELGKTTLKKHKPTTDRKNTEDGYRGCLRVDVRNGADLYRRIEGWWCGIVLAARSTGTDHGTRT
ncbi:hypothetical protein [Streptomyces uncialis]|uniref:hypothetical protein n=1 Tax=Streptomyces uncialis TaxID=1048205 RepID=UPI0037A0FA42